MSIVIGYWLIFMQFVFQVLLLIPELIWNSLLAVISWVAQLANLSLGIFGVHASMPIAFDLNGSGHIDSLLPFAPNIDWGQYVCVIGDPNFFPSMQIQASFTFSSNPWDYTTLGYVSDTVYTGGHSVGVGGLVPGVGYDQPQPMGHSAIRVINGQHPIWGWLPAL